MKCEICKDNKVFAYYYLFDRGWFLCEGCACSCLTQYYGFSNNTINDYLRWVVK